VTDSTSRDTLPATNNPYRVAIVGAGLIAARSHLPAAPACPAVEVAAIVDPNLDRARRPAEVAGIKDRIAAEFDEVIGSVDLSVITAPNHLHCPPAVRCLLAGVHTLIEKPLAFNAREAETIADTAEQSGATVCVGFHRPSTRLMREPLSERRYDHSTTNRPNSRNTPLGYGERRWRDTSEVR
jgi:predicted dehydrogenase